MSSIEIILFIIAVLSLLIMLKRYDYSWREALLACVCLAPILFFSINRMTDVVTVDEPRYISAITNIREIKNMGIAEKLVGQYKVSQFIVGAIFLCIPSTVKSQMTTGEIWATYKCAHWIVLFVVILVILNIFNKFILRGENESKRKIINVFVLGSLLGLPLSCLLLKVTNYDGFSTYFIVLGYIMLWAGIQADKKIMGYGSVCMIALGVFEKGPALPYWLFGIIIFAFYEIRNIDSLWKKARVSVATVLKLTLLSVLLSVCYFVITAFLQNGFYRYITVDDIVYSYEETIRNISFLSTMADLPVVSVLLEMFIMAFCAIVWDAILRGISRRGDLVGILLRIDVAIAGVITVFGIFSAYFIPVRVSPFLEIADGYYNPTFAANGAANHFGARTHLGHIICKLGYSCAVIMANYPVIVIGLFTGLLILSMKKLYDDRALICALMFGGLFSICFVFALLDLPADARYYSVPLMMVVIISIYLCGIYYPPVGAIKRAICSSLVLIYFVEMIFYLPNVKAFTPIWLWHDSDYNKGVRTGVSHAGEVMLWGENVAIGGRMIQDLLETEDDYLPERINLYTNYGGTWPNNPGYQILAMNGSVTFDSNSFFIFNKFSLYRSEIPNFIYEVDPILTIEYKGEIGAWIYRGDQLAEYQEWFAGN